MIERKLKWVVAVKIKLAERVKVKNSIELAHKKDEMNNFKLPILNVDWLCTLIDDNDKYEVVN